MSLINPDSPRYAQLPDEEPETVHCYACGYDVCRCDSYDERRDNDVLEAWA